MSIESQLAAIEQRAEKATPGPHEVYSDGEAACIAAPSGHVCNFFADHLRESTEEGVPIGKADADFFARAREDVPRLVNVVRYMLANAHWNDAERSRIESILSTTDKEQP